MGIITDAVVAAIKETRKDAAELSADELAAIDAKVAEATQGLEGKVTSLEGDMKRIADALTDGNLTAEATTEAIGEIVGTPPVNSQPTE